MPTDPKSAKENLDAAALEYHEYPRPGKIAVTPTKQLSNQRDLALAYSPGVAAACDEIDADPATAFRSPHAATWSPSSPTARRCSGSASIGPLAAKPVMEGKGVLFKKFAGIDVFDIEINETDPDKLVEIIAALEPTFGGINLEDIKAPECFYVERKLREPHEDPGLPRRPARHRDHRRRRGPQRPAGRRQGNRRRSSWCATARARRRSPASICWSSSASSARTSASPTSRAWCTRGRNGAHGRGQGALRAEDRRRARSPKSSPAPTSSSACRPRAC